jgi:aldose 1-epimerase
MLSAHNYWNLGAFVSSEAETILENTLTIPAAKRYIGTDGILVPTGEIRVTKGTPLDFTASKPARSIGRDIAEAEDYCGTGCVGYDNALILDRPYSASHLAGMTGGDVGGSDGSEAEVLRMWAPTTGIEMKLWTNMGGLQMYSCDGLNGTIAVKESQQHGNANAITTKVPKYGCLVLETQDVSWSFLLLFFSSFVCVCVCVCVCVSCRLSPGR